MRNYQFLFINARGIPALMDFADHADDDPACRAGAEMLSEHSTAVAVEVHDGDRFILRIDKTRDQTWSRLGREKVRTDSGSPGPASSA